MLDIGEGPETSCRREGGNGLEEGGLWPGVALGVRCRG